MIDLLPIPRCNDIMHLRDSIASWMVMATLTYRSRSHIVHLGRGVEAIVSALRLGDKALTGLPRDNVIGTAQRRNYQASGVC